MNGDGRELEQQLDLKEFALDHAREAVYLIDAQLRFVYVNDEACRTLGYRREELIGLTPSDINPDYTPEDAMRVQEKTLATGSCMFETRHRRRDGSLFPVEVQTSIFEYRGQVMHMALVRDISVRKQAEQAFAARERDFRTLAENSPDPIYRYDRDCRRVYVNPAVERISGVSASLLLGKTPTETRLVPSAESVKVLQSIERVLDTGVPDDIEVLFVAPDGSELYFQNRHVPEFGPDGTVESVLSIGRDITERKQSETVLRERAELEQRLSATTANLPGFIFTIRVGTDGRTSFPFASAGVEDLFGLRPEDIRDNVAVLRARYHHDDLPRLLDLMKETERTLMPFRIEIRIRNRDNQQSWIEIRSMPQRQPDGATEWHGIMLDITERKQAEALLEQREREFRSLGENLPDNVARWDAAGRYLYVNPTHESTLGMPAADVVGRRIGDVFPDTHTEVQAAIAQVVATGQPALFVQQPVPAENGETRIHDVSLVPERDANGKVVSVLGLGRDMTDIYRMQETIDAREQELRALAESSPGMMGSFHLRPDGSVCMPYVSPNIWELFGLRPQDVADDAAPLMALNHPDDAQRVGEAIAESARTMTPWREEYRILHPTRGERWMEGHTNPMPHPDGGIVWYGYVHDITERKRLEAELREQTDFQQTLLDAMNDVGMQLMMIENGRIVHVGNRELARQFGYSDAELDAHPALVDIIHPDDRERVMDYYLSRLAGEAMPSSYEVGLVTRDGERREYETAVAVVPDTDPVRIVTVGKDITERQRLEDALNASEEKHRVVFESANDGIFLHRIVERDGNTEFVLHDLNRKGCELWGHSREDILSGNFDLLAMNNPPYSFEEATRRNRLAAAGQPQLFDWQLKRGDGSKIWGEVNLRRTRIGGEDFLLATIRELTERKRMEEALRENRESLNEAQRIAHVGSWGLDLVSGVLTWSEEIFHIFEIDPAHFGASYEAFLAMVHPEDRDALNTVYTESFEKRIPYDFEHRLLMPDGRIKHVHERCETHYAEDGKPLRSLGTVQDITERKRLEERLVKREREFRALAENSPDSVVRYDRDCRFVYANPIFERMLGCSLDELRGKTPTQVPGLQDAEFFEKRVWEVMQTGVADEFEYPVQAATGNAFWGLVHIVPEFDEAGQVVFVQVLTRDITALKEAERYLAESHERLRELALHWDSEQEAERKRLAWEVHEGIGQNLMSLRMNLQMTGKETAKDGHVLRKRIGEMLGLLDNTVGLVRDVTVALRPRMLDFGLATALEWLADEFRAKHGIACEIDQPKTGITLNERVGTVLFRVVEAALSHFARLGSAERVAVTVEKVGYSCRLTVHEQLKGFDEAAQTDDEDFGLAWIQEQITAMGGEFVMFTLPGQGTTIEATLPMRDDL